MTLSEEAENFLQGLMLGRGCEYSHIDRQKIETINDCIDDLKIEIKKMRDKLDLIYLLVVVLSFMAGGDLLVRIMQVIFKG